MNITRQMIVAAQLAQLRVQAAKNEDVLISEAVMSLSAELVKSSNDVDSAVDVLSFVEVDAKYDCEQFFGDEYETYATMGYDA